jgi:hypothetical protein
VRVLIAGIMESIQGWTSWFSLGLVLAGLQQEFELVGISGTPGLQSGIRSFPGLVLGDQRSEVLGEADGERGGLVGDDLVRISGADIRNQ